MTDSSQTDFARAPLILASRKSQLALAQTEQVRRALVDIPTEILGLSTTGDEVLDRPLVEVGGKGVFIKTLEAALLDGRADAAVHSLKDMETQLASGTEVAVVLPREDRGDALVGPYPSLDDLPDGAHIGTASVRRAALLRHYRPDLNIGLLRGNVNSRLRRLEAGEFDAIILAVAGLKRLQLDCAYTALDEQICRPPPRKAQSLSRWPLAASGQQRFRQPYLLFIVWIQLTVSPQNGRFWRPLTGPAAPHLGHGGY